MAHSLKQELFDLDFHTINGRLELRCFVCGYWTTNDGTRDTASASKSYFAVAKMKIVAKRDENEWNCLVLYPEYCTRSDFWLEFWRRSDVPWNKNVWDVLVLTQERQMKKNLDGLGISCHNDKFRDTSIQGLRSFISTLFCLFVVGCLLNKVQESNSQVCICEGKGFFGHIGLADKGRCRRSMQLFFYFGVLCSASDVDQFVSTLSKMLVTAPTSRSDGSMITRKRLWGKIWIGFAMDLSDNFSLVLARSVCTAPENPRVREKRAKSSPNS